MKAIFDPIKASKELKEIGSVVRTNAVAPIVQCIKMSFEKKVLTMTATDFNTTVLIKMDAEHKVDFEACVPFVDLLDICTKSCGPLIIDVSDTSIKFFHEKGKLSLPILAEAKHFPLIEETNYENTATVDGDFFFALSGANTCRHKESVMVYMTNPAIDFQKDKITTVGSNSITMFLKHFPIACKKTIVATVLTEFVNQVKLFQESELSVSEKFIRVVYGDKTVISRLSENPFVDYKYVLPKTKVEYNFSCNKNDLKDAVSIVGTTADKSTKEVIFYFEGEVKILSCDGYLDKQGESPLLAQSSVEIPSIKVSGSELLNLLSTIPGDEIEFAFVDPEKPVFLRPKDDESTLLYIMPLFLQPKK